MFSFVQFFVIKEVILLKKSHHFCSSLGAYILMMENVFPLCIMLRKLFLQSSDRFILFTSMFRFSLNSIDTPRLNLELMYEWNGFPFHPISYFVSFS